MSRKYLETLDLIWCKTLRPIMITLKFSRSWETFWEAVDNFFLAGILVQRQPPKYERFTITLLESILKLKI